MSRAISTVATFISSMIFRSTPTTNRAVQLPPTQQLQPSFPDQDDTERIASSTSYHSAQQSLPASPTIAPFQLPAPPPTQPNTPTQSATTLQLALPALPTAAQPTPPPHSGSSQSKNKRRKTNKRARKANGEIKTKKQKKKEQREAERRRKRAERERIRSFESKVEADFQR